MYVGILRGERKCETVRSSLLLESCLNAQLLWKCWHNAGTAQFKRGVPDFSSPLPDNIFVELWFQVNTSVSILALTQTTDWMVVLRSTLAIGVFKRLLLGIFPFIVSVLGCSNETPHSPMFFVHKHGTQFRALWSSSWGQAPGSQVMQCLT